MGGNLPNPFYKPDMDTATITKQNYKPISLANINMKILKKTSANYTPKNTSKEMIIRHCQVGFVPAIQMHFNIFKPINTANQSIRRKIKM